MSTLNDIVDGLSAINVTGMAELSELGLAFSTATPAEQYVIAMRMADLAHRMNDGVNEVLSGTDGGIAVIGNGDTDDEVSAFAPAVENDLSFASKASEEIVVDMRHLVPEDQMERFELLSDWVTMTRATLYDTGGLFDQMKTATFEDAGSLRAQAQSTAESYTGLVDDGGPIDMSGEVSPEVMMVLHQQMEDAQYARFLLGPVFQDMEDGHLDNPASLPATYQAADIITAGQASGDGGEMSFGGA